MEKYCKSCGRVFKNSDFKVCPYCGNQLSTRTGRQPIPRQLRHQVFQRDGYRCRECGATNKETRLHVDHIKPVAKGGTNDLSNLQTLCEACNLAKYTDEWVGGKLNNNEQNNTRKRNKKDNFVCWKSDEIKLRYKTLYEQLLSEEKEVSMSELLDFAGINYHEVVEGELYYIFHDKKVYERFEQDEKI